MEGNLQCLTKIVEYIHSLLSYLCLQLNSSVAFLCTSSINSCGRFARSQRQKHRDPCISKEMFNEFGSRLGRLIFRISSYNHYCSWSRFAASKEDFWLVQAWTNLADMYLTSHFAAPILVLAPESSTAFSMARRSGRALPFLARNRNTTQNDTSTSTSSENSKLSGNATEEEVYRGKEYLTGLPIEVLLMILSYVQAPGDEHWDDKSDLKAINLFFHGIGEYLVPDSCSRPTVQIHDAEVHI